MVHTLERCEPTKHSYEPRYDERLPKDDFTSSFFNHKEKIYIYDICTKCGHTIEKNNV